VKYVKFKTNFLTGRYYTYHTANTVFLSALICGRIQNF